MRLSITAITAIAIHGAALCWLFGARWHVIGPVIAAGFGL